MFDSLSSRLEGIVKRLRGKGRLTADDVDEMLKEIRTALLEADVNVGVVRNVTARIREQAIGTVVFALILVVSGFYLFLTVKEVRLNQRQSNFVDSVTHELKTPIASLRLYLDTLRMRHVEPRQQTEFFNVMDAEIGRAHV